MRAIELASDMQDTFLLNISTEVANRTERSIPKWTTQAERWSNMGGERKPHTPHTHLPANRDPTAVNTLPSRIPHATLITVHFTSSHITAIQLPPTLADAQLRELLVNATLSARSSPHDNQLLRRSQRLFPHSRVNPSGNATEEPQRVAAPKTKPIRLRIERSLPQGLLQAHLALNERRVEELTQECQVARSASNRNLASARAFLNDGHAAKSLRQVRQTDHVHRPHRPAPTLYPDVNELHILPGRVHVRKRLDPIPHHQLLSLRSRHLALRSRCARILSQTQKMPNTVLNFRSTSPSSSQSRPLERRQVQSNNTHNRHPVAAGQCTQYPHPAHTRVHARLFNLQTSLIWTTVPD